MMAEVRIDGARLRAVMQALAGSDASDRLAVWFGEAGCDVRIDADGHIVARRAGQNEALAPVVVVGVADGLEIVRALNDRGIATERAIVVIGSGHEAANAAAVHAIFEIHVGQRDLDDRTIVVAGADDEACGAARDAAARLGLTSRTIVVDRKDTSPTATIDAASIEDGCDVLLLATLAKADELPMVSLSSETLAIA